MNVVSVYMSVVVEDKWINQFNKLSFIKEINTPNIM